MANKIWGLMAFKELGTLRAQPGSKPPMLHHNVLAIALANKLARIAWTWGPAKEGLCDHGSTRHAELS